MVLYQFRLGQVGGILMGYFLPFEGAVALVAVVALVFVMAVFDGFKRKKR